MPISQTRRSFVRIVLCLAAAALVGLGCGYSSPPSIEKIAGYLVSLIKHPQAAADIGGSYIQSDSALGSLSFEQLVALILSEAGLGDAETLDVSLDEIGRVLKRKVRRDFADEAVVTVDGWLLSRTEAQLCALVHIQRRT